MSVTSINTSNGSGITASSSTGDVILNSLSAGLNGIVISGGTGKQVLISASDVDFSSMSLDSASGKTVKLIADSTLANNDVYTLPPALPTVAGQVLASDTTGIMSWSTGGGSVSNPMTADLFAGTYGIKNLGGLSFVDTTGDNITTIVAGSQAGNITYTLPNATPTVAGQVLSADLGGTMSWVDNGSSGGVANPMTSNLIAGGFAINDLASLQIKAGTSAFTTAISGVTQTANIAYTLPNASPGATDQVLSCDASGAMSWLNALTNPLNDNLGCNGFAINNASGLQIKAGTTAFTSTINGGTQTADITYTLPIAQPTAGQLLSSNATGTMSWVSGISNPLGSDLNANGNNITGLNQLNISGTTTSPAYFSITNTTTNTQSQIQTSPTQSPSLITILLPPTFGSADNVLAIDSVATGNVIATKWMSNSLPANLVYNPLTADLNANTRNISGIGQLTAGILTLSPTAGSSGILSIANAGNTSVSFIVNGLQSINNTYTLPNGYPSTAGYVLSSDTTGTMSWIANGSGSSTVTGVMNATGTVTAVGNVYFVNISMGTTLPAGQYIFSANWHFISPATFTADNTMFTGIGTSNSGQSIYSTDQMIQDGQVIGSSAVIATSFNVNLSASSTIFLNIGIDDTTKVTLTSNDVACNIYYIKVA